MVRATNGHHHHDINSVLAGIRAKSQPMGPEGGAPYAHDPRGVSGGAAAAGAAANGQAHSYFGGAHHAPQSGSQNAASNHPGSGTDGPQAAHQQSGQQSHSTVGQSSHPDIAGAAGHGGDPNNNAPSAEAFQHNQSVAAHPREQVYRGQRFVPGGHRNPQTETPTARPLGDVSGDEEDDAQDLPTILTRSSLPSSGPRRLTDALRHATGRGDSAQPTPTVLPRATDQDAIDGRIEPTWQLSSMDEDRGRSVPRDADTTHPSAPMQPDPSGAIAPHNGVDQPPVGAGPSRTTMSFKDTRMSRMARKSEASDGEASADVAAIVGPAIDHEALPASDDTTAHVAGSVREAPVASDIHDVAAELLRPMLKDWVGENMPQIVEKALSQERNAGSKNGTKF